MKTRILLVFIGIFAFACSSDDNSVTNSAPSNFGLTQIADQSNNVELQPSFAWAEATDPDGDEISYDFYLDTSNPPTTLVASNLNAAMYELQEELEPETTYYWKVVAKDSEGNETGSNVFSFTTRSMTISELIIGKWFLQSLEIGGADQPISECQQNNFLLFMDNGETYAEYYNLTSEECSMNINQSGTYEILNGNILKTVMSESSTRFLEIISISETELTLSESNMVALYHK